MIIRKWKVCANCCAEKKQARLVFGFTVLWNAWLLCYLIAVNIVDVPENVVYQCCVLVSYLENILSLGITASPVPPVLFQEAKGGQEEANPKQRSCLNNITKQNNKNNIFVLIFSKQKYFEADNVKKVLTCWAFAPAMVLPLGSCMLKPKNRASETFSYPLKEYFLCTQKTSHRNNN